MLNYYRFYEEEIALIEAGQALQNVLQEALVLQEGTEIHDRLPTVMMPRKIWWI